jgi:hypothetical protein
VVLQTRIFFLVNHFSWTRKKIQFCRTTFLKPDFSNQIFRTRFLYKNHGLIIKGWVEKFQFSEFLLDDKNAPYLSSFKLFLLYIALGYVFFSAFVFGYCKKIHISKIFTRVSCPNKYNFVQVNLCQKLFFLHQLTHNMTNDCPWTYQFSKWKLQVQNMLCTQIVFFVFVLAFWTIYVHNMFWACSFHVLNWYFYEQSVLILWIS